ncbi:hypothetical protein AVEN_223731-1 [Araneus ventricosus]|uniref:Uncharacterized protein n=1 Tax=Araneus ventricosus TaxID=182803 RepID=A0A4Y2NH02_ARAVE|nr:hypothetical protein AVEN_223731-1 [Araneus ventricosus]
MDRPVSSTLYTQSAGYESLLKASANRSKKIVAFFLLKPKALAYDVPQGLGIDSVSLCLSRKRSAQARPASPFLKGVVKPFLWASKYDILLRSAKVHPKKFCSITKR